MTDTSAAAATAASGASAYATSIGASAYGMLTATEWAAVGGLMLAVLTFCVNWGYQAQRNKREQEQHQAFMDSLRVGKVGRTPIEDRLSKVLERLEDE